MIVDTKSEQNLILKQRKNLEAEGFVQTCQQQIVLGQRPSTCDSKVKHSKHSEKKLHIIFSQLIRTRAVQSPRFAFSNIRLFGEYGRGLINGRGHKLNIYLKKK